GSLAWELHWPDNVWEYRAFKFEWQTDLFETNVDSYDFGTFSGYTAVPYIFVLTNNSDEDVEITSTHNFTTSYGVVTGLPLTIPANGTANLTINFFPTQQGQINDVLTIRSETMFADTLPQMIACQVFLTGYVVDENAPEASISPVDGSIDVLLDTQVKITFDESIVKVDGSILKSTDIPNIIEFKETDALGVDVEYSAYIDAWKRQIVITSELESIQQYYIELKANTVADNSGNILTSSVSSTFTTADVEAPVAIFFPEDSAVDVMRNVIVTLTFDEKIYKLGGDEILDEDLPGMFLYKENDTLGPDVAYTATINADKTEIYLMSDEDLGEYQQYYSVFYGNMVQDEVGNILETDQVITFTTGEEFGVGENIWKNQFRIFPNPNTGILNIKFNNIDSKEILVYNLEGSLVYSADKIEQETYEIDIQDLPAGIYVIKVRNMINNSVVEMKTVKH
ncbi:MAG: Ig-like domain-containing protein, partial [Bacteroidales bacterium]|nr:Ig-like domain-containing protein [Bacteroidales bacterium]